MDTIEVEMDEVSFWDDIAMQRMFSNPQPVVIVHYPDYRSEGFLVELTLDVWTMPSISWW